MIQKQFYYYFSLSAEVDSFLLTLILEKCYMHVGFLLTKKEQMLKTDLQRVTEGAAIQNYVGCHLTQILLSKCCVPEDLI
jgi:hypothetical protein